MELNVVGLRAAPRETLEDLQQALRSASFNRLVVTLVTDWQDQRNQARYAVFARGGLKAPVLSLDAFGPAFGKPGEEALATLVQWLREKGVTHFYEAVLPPSEYSALFLEDPEEVYKRLVAAANPTDPALYLDQARFRR
ncbi:DUF3197 domain-containing protein [Calidithermus roseus]|uniref:Uncharacterized protein n=1 Tax=Calidithermus roseus TaxID=1644118 RepID=A0A399EG05_9DEIN|nr:DUF3197 domain-containing protein [Calidithermus roseus]RIH82079.1 hypothetical protein Mrose_03468 [Calidithermus roseus]